MMILIQGHITRVSPRVFAQSKLQNKERERRNRKKHVIYQIGFLIVALICFAVLFSFVSWVFFFWFLFLFLFVFVCFVCFIVFCIFCFFHFTQFSPDLSKFFNLCLCCMLAWRTHGSKSSSLNKEPSLLTQSTVLEKTKVRPGYRERK